MSASAALLLLLAAGTSSPVIDDAAHRSEIESWRKARENRLRSDEGWLTVAGLFWLKEGENPVGSDPGAAVVLPAHSSPARAGVLRVKGGKVAFEAAPGVAVTAAGKPVQRMELRADVPGPPDVLALGRLRFFAILRSGKLAIRLRDLDSPARKSFRGLSFFPIRKEYRVVGRFVPHPAPKKLAVPNVLGLVEELVSPGVVTFQLQGKQLKLEPVYETADARELFFIFRDRTAGKETYGAGRFFYAELPRDGQVVLDFNKAYTPPCAFTRFATCPLPPRQNLLPVRIEAGELGAGDH
jgi:uncharacterized protein (DUF1684 family)